MLRGVSMRIWYFIALVESIYTVPFQIMGIYCYLDKFKFVRFSFKFVRFSFMISVNMIDIIVVYAYNIWIANDLLNIKLIDCK